MKKSRARSIKVGLIGCGTIGSYLAENIHTCFYPMARIAFLHDRHAENAERLKRALGGEGVVTSFDKVLTQSDLIIEAASQEAAVKIVKKALGFPRKKILIMSAAGLLKLRSRRAGFWTKVRAKVLVPSGAVAGIDGLLAAKEAGIRKVLLRTRKPPAGLENAPYFQKHKFPILKAGEEKCVFKGSAAQAVEQFPKNINVAALLSLAGIGEKKTRVEIWTSRSYRCNRHEIDIDHQGGRVKIETENRPSKGNPRTSALAMYSAVATLRKYFSSLQTGT